MNGFIVVCVFIVGIFTYAYIHDKRVDKKRAAKKLKLTERLENDKDRYRVNINLRSGKTIESPVFDPYFDFFCYDCEYMTSKHQAERFLKQEKAIKGSDGKIYPYHEVTKKEVVKVA